MSLLIFPILLWAHNTNIQLDANDAQCLHHEILQLEMKMSCCASSCFLLTSNQDLLYSRYRNECDYQEQLRGTLEQLNKVPKCYYTFTTVILPYLTLWLMKYSSFAKRIETQSWKWHTDGHDFQHFLFFCWILFTLLFTVFFSLGSPCFLFWLFSCCRRLTVHCWKTWSTKSTHSSCKMTSTLPEIDTRRSVTRLGNGLRTTKYSVYYYTILCNSYNRQGSYADESDS